MSNCEVGDRVVVVKNNHPEQSMNCVGQRGVVSTISDKNDYGVGVRLGGSLACTMFDSDELVLEDVYDALSAKPVEEPLYVEAKVDSSDEDAVSHPSHYTSHPSGVECKDVAGHYSFNVGSAFKYLWRHLDKHDDPITDLKKARQFLAFEIERLGGTVG